MPAYLPHWATNKWIEEKADIIQSNVLINTQFKNLNLSEEQLLQLSNRNVIKDAAKTFIVEFIRQTQDVIPNLNRQASAPTSELLEKAAVGQSHVEILAQTLKECGLTKEQLIPVIGSIIAASTSHYLEYPPAHFTQDEWQARANASIRRDLDGLKKKLDELYPTSTTPNVIRQI